MKVNDYVRTREGIKKVLKYTYNDKYENGHCVWFDNKDNGVLFTNEEVNKMKPSPNIIDLIEVGDYVNGMEVTGIGGTRWDENDLHCYCEHNGNENWKQVMIPAKDIKSIVTKEQFSQMEYKVGGNDD